MNKYSNCINFKDEILLVPQPKAKSTFFNINNSEKKNKTYLTVVMSLSATGLSRVPPVPIEF